jgi:hypothetical protein
LQVDIKKGEKKLYTWNIGQSTEQFMARPRSRKADMRAVRPGMGGTTFLALLGTERRDCGEQGMCVSRGGDP